MDGNGRWAGKRGLPRSAGHREGARVLKKIVRAADKIGVRYLTVYAFSTENWKRPKAEVDSLMELLMQYLKNAEEEIGGENIRIRVAGNINALSEEFRREIARVTRNTEKNSGLTLTIALNYGGRDEIANAAKRVAADVLHGNLWLDDINEEVFAKYLYFSGIPDPDLVIRPSGEMRLSNYLLWQSAYSEFWYDSILWPDFTEADLKRAVCDYQKRNRRFGGIG
jgi:undecaprenyl diphosphate synthase